MVRRDPELGDNKILPAVLAQRLGDTVYARLRYGFEDQAFGAPEPCRTGDLDCVADGMSTLVDAFVAKGYALRGSVSAVGGGGEGGDQSSGGRRVSVKLSGPATQWSAQALAARGVNPPNEYVG